MIVFVLVVVSLSVFSGVAQASGSWWDALVDTPDVNTTSTTTTTEPPKPPVTDTAALASFLDSEFLIPHNSSITGEMLTNVSKWYGIPIIAELVILGAETSLGDPKLGGVLTHAGNNNFGCMRWSKDRTTKWGMLAEPEPVWVAGKSWFKFKTPALGMAAWGRLIKVGPSGSPGFYLACVTAKPVAWYRFARVYYGAGVARFDSYVSGLVSQERRFMAIGREHGFDLSVTIPKDG